MTIKVNLIFPPTMVTFPLMTLLVRQYELEVNILHADIRLNKTGKLIVELTGEKKNIDQALQYIEQQGITYHVFNGTLTWEEENCVHCGACTSVCPPRALTIDAPDYTLAYDKEKCLICGLCVKACPLRILHLAQREPEA
ncbi:MAG: 4Fe-4S binding protein [Thermoclostridium sp.]|nr:4Fe-4S binding protein [Thermoclostridium sp.]